jgi:hypothetical protein
MVGEWVMSGLGSESVVSNDDSVSKMVILYEEVTEIGSPSV